MKTYWILDGEPIGPFDLNRLKSFVDTGNLKKNDWVCLAEENQVWEIAGTVKELKPLFGISNPTTDNVDKYGRQSSSKSKPDKGKTPEDLGKKNRTESKKPKVTFVQKQKTRETSSLKMSFLANNPFRVLDIEVDASKRQIEKAFSKAKAFASVGKIIKPKSSYGITQDLDFSEENITRAKALLDQPKSRLRSSFFWFSSGSAVDEMAFKAFEKNDEEKAHDLWSKISKNKPISKSNYSSFRNLSLYLLAKSESGGVIIEDNLKESLRLAGSIFSSSYCDDFARNLPSVSFDSTVKESLSQTYVDDITEELDKVLEKSSVTLKKFIQYFSEFPVSVRNKIKNKYCSPYVREIEDLLESAEISIEKNVDKALSEGKHLLKKTKPNLAFLRDILGPNDIKYKDLCASIASLLEKISTKYFNHCMEQDPPNDPGKSCIKIDREALKIYSDGHIGNKIREGIKFLEGWNASKDEREITQFLIRKLENTKNSSSIAKAKNLVETCTLKLIKLKKVLGSVDDFYNWSDAVGSVASGICVKCCNESEPSSYIYREAMEVMNLIKRLETSSEFNSRFQRNFKILSDNLNAQESRSSYSNNSSSSSSSSSGCYIATMAYGSATAPEVITLKKFRDQKLRNHFVGRGFISLYYKTSPMFVQITKGWSWLHPPLRTLINQLVKITK